MQKISETIIIHHIPLVPPIQTRCFRRYKMMKRFFYFCGRGNNVMSDDKFFSLDPDPGAVLMLTRKYGHAEFVVTYCRSALVEQWCCYCVGAFSRFSDLGFTRSWAEPAESDLTIHYAVTVYLVAELDWMRRSS